MWGRGEETNCFIVENFFYPIVCAIVCFFFKNNRKILRRHYFWSIFHLIYFIKDITYLKRKYSLFLNVFFPTQKLKLFFLVSKTKSTINEYFAQFFATYLSFYWKKKKNPTYFTYVQYFLIKINIFISIYLSFLCIVKIRHNLLSKKKKYSLT